MKNYFQNLYYRSTSGSISGDRWRIAVFSKPFDPRVNYFYPKDKAPFTLYSRLEGIYSREHKIRKNGYLHLSPLMDPEVDL